MVRCFPLRSLGAIARAGAFLFQQWPCVSSLRPAIWATPPAPGSSAGWSGPSLAIGSEQRARLVEAVAGEQQALDVPAVPGPQLDLEKVAPERVFPFCSN
jgi:hypothetical protein